MAKHVGVKLPDNLIEYLKTEKVVVVLATFSEKGLPHTTPISCIWPKGQESLLMTIHKELIGYHNMVWQKKVMINIMGDGNIAYSILGRAGVVRAPSMVHPLMNIVRVDVIDIKCDRSILSKIEKGVEWSYTSTEAQSLVKNLFLELKDVANSI